MKAETTLAYMAGIIDADGFISAHRKRHGERIYCSPLIGIAGTQDEPHQLAVSLWRGSFFRYRPKNPGHRLQFQWQAVGEKAATAIADVKPYLLSKLPQATLALEMWELIAGGAHRTDPRLLAMADRLSEMNLRRPPKKAAKQMGGVRDPRADLDDLPADLRVREFPT